MRREQEQATHPLDKLLAVLANDATGEANLAKTDILVHLLGVLCVKRTPSTAHFKQEDAETPKVDELRVAVVIEEDLGREVLCGAAKGVCKLSGGQIGL